MRQSLCSAPLSCVISVVTMASGRMRSTWAQSLSAHRCTAVYGVKLKGLVKGLFGFVMEELDLFDELGVSGRSAVDHAACTCFMI